MQVEHIIQNSGLIEHFSRERGEKARMRIENLQELVSAAGEFNPEAAAMQGMPEMAPLSAFLACSALESGDAGAHEHDAVQLMTLHAAKGLEFPVVFMCGLEEGLFPHYMTADDPKGLAEERRLCYVGVTRAMRELYLTHAETRRLHGREVRHRASRFLQEIPEECLNFVRMTTTVHRQKHVADSAVNKSAQLAGHGMLRVGQEVSHKKFGHGVVLQCEGMGEHARVKVQFATEGIKWLVAGFVTP